MPKGKKTKVVKFGWDKKQLKNLLSTMPEPTAEPQRSGYIQIDKKGLQQLKQFQQYKYKPGGVVHLGTDPSKTNVFFDEYTGVDLAKPNTPTDWAEGWYEKNVGRK